MDLLLALLGFALCLIGILGSFLPILPGPPLGWAGLLLLYLTSAVPMDWWVLGTTLVIAITVVVLDYIIPAVGTKKFGGSRAGMIGTLIGLVVALFIPLFGIFGIIIWPFVGALVGEFVNRADRKTAIKAAFGSFIGFLTGTFLKFVVGIVFLGIFIRKAWTFREALFPYLYN